MTDEILPRRTRMPRKQRRLQLIEIGRAAFAQRGYDGTSIEEIATAAGVSKPIIYEHFGGKEGLYQVIVDREITSLIDTLADAMPEDSSPRRALEGTIVTLLDYLETHPDGHRLLAHQSPAGVSSGVFSPIMGEVAEHLTAIIAKLFAGRGFDPTAVRLYGQLLGGSVAQVGMWWITELEEAAADPEIAAPDKNAVAAHTVNLLWNGLHRLERHPSLHGHEADEKTGDEELTGNAS
ncbi:MAG: TetR/AcrR family transcriptional regulator [Flaviflexus sp.]|nr:TetR/AcrR family transcriptional regulator [Flaviflexus sp.]